MSSRQLFQYDPLLGHRFIPGLRLRVEHETGGYLLRTNSSGFRSDYEFTSERPPGRRRVLLFGDSFTAGDGVSNPQRYGDRLEQLMPDVQVLNFGLSGSGTDQQLLLFREVKDAYEHDVVVIGLLVENIRRIVAHYRLYRSSDGIERAHAKPYFVLGSSGDLELRNVPVPREAINLDHLPEAERGFVDMGGQFHALRRAVGKLGAGTKELVQRVSRFQPLPEYDSKDSAAWLLMRTLLTAWASESAVPVIVVPIPLYHYVEELSSPVYQRRFAELRTVANLEVYDPLPALLAYDKALRRKFRFDKDVHLTPSGHEALAAAIAPRVGKVRSQAGSAT